VAKEYESAHLLLCCINMNLTPNQLEQIVRLYKSGQSIYKIAPVVGCAPQTVHKKLVLLGVPRRDRSGLMESQKQANAQAEAERVALILQKQEERADMQKEIAERYRKGESMLELRRSTGHAVPSIKSWIVKNQIEQRTASQACRIHSLNENAFSDILTEPQAYWLGFLTADGGISHHSSLRINLQERDRAHVEAFQKFMQTSIPVARQIVKCKDKQYPVSYLNIGSIKICADLARYGLGPRKSKTVRWPACLPDHLAPHYVRGVFDGDGTWSTITKKGGIAWMLLGNRPFLLDVQQVMMQYCDLSQTKLIDHHTTTDIALLSYSGSTQVARIASWMYTGSTICLNRKLARYIEHLELFYPQQVDKFRDILHHQFSA
jgi:Helix-turn-helix domain of resolvase